MYGTGLNESVFYFLNSDLLPMNCEQQLMKYWSLSLHYDSLISLNNGRLNHNSSFEAPLIRIVKQCSFILIVYASIVLISLLYDALNIASSKILLRKFRSSFVTHTKGIINQQRQGLVIFHRPFFSKHICYSQYSYCVEVKRR